MRVRSNLNLTSLALLAGLVLVFVALPRAWSAYHFYHDWYLIEPPVHFEGGFKDTETMLKSMKSDSAAPTQCWDILSTYPSNEACDDVLKKTRAEASAEIKTRGDPLNVTAKMLSQRCIAAADPTAPPPGGLACVSRSELLGLQRPAAQPDSKKPK